MKLWLLPIGMFHLDKRWGIFRVEYSIPRESLFIITVEPVWLLRGSLMCNLHCTEFSEKLCDQLFKWCEYVHILPYQPDLAKFCFELNMTCTILIFKVLFKSISFIYIIISNSYTFGIVTWCVSGLWIQVTRLVASRYPSLSKASEEVSSPLALPGELVCQESCSSLRKHMCFGVRQRCRRTT